LGDQSPKYSKEGNEAVVLLWNQRKLPRLQWGARLKQTTRTGLTRDKRTRRFGLLEEAKKKKKKGAILGKRRATERVDEKKADISQKCGTRKKVDKEQNQGAVGRKCNWAQAHQGNTNNYQKNES